MPFSSFKKVQKANARVHRERAQPTERRHLGILPKKKDFKVRAQDAQLKRSTLKFLQQKALEKNPEEFYFGMVNSQVVEGIHKELPRSERKKFDPSVQEAERKSNVKRDLVYLKHRLTKELHRIDRLKQQLALPSGSLAELGLLEDSEVAETPTRVVYVDKKAMDSSKNKKRHGPSTSSNVATSEEDLETVESALKLTLQQKRLYHEVHERIKLRNKIRARIAQLETKNLTMNLKRGETVIEKDGQVIQRFRRK